MPLLLGSTALHREYEQNGIDDLKAAQAKTIEELDLRKKEMDVLKEELVSLARGRPAQDTRPIEALFAPQFEELSRELLDIFQKQNQGDQKMADMATAVHHTAREVVTIQTDIKSRHHLVVSSMEQTREKIQEK